MTEFLTEFLTESLLPADLSLLWAVALIVMSFFTSSFTAAFGVGGGVALITVMLLVLPPTLVIPVHGVVQAGSNIGRAVVMREHIRWPVFRWFLAGTIVGVTVASFIIVDLPAGLLKIVLASFVLWALWMPKPKTRAVSDSAYSIVGAVASFCTMFVGATGVLVAAFWQTKLWGKDGVVATHAACIAVQHLFKVLAFIAIGFVFTDWIALIAAMVIAGYAGTLLGKRLLAKLPEKTFAKAFKLVLSVLALNLLVSALWSAAVT